MECWRSSCVDSRKLCTYKDFKIDFIQEPYLNAIDVNKFRKCLASFRFSCHDLMIEKGRHQNILAEDRNCVYCECYLEDEFHFVLICPLYSDVRKTYISELYVSNANYEMFIRLMSSTKEKEIRNLAMYLYNAFKIRKDFLIGHI